MTVSTESPNDDLPAARATRHSRIEKHRMTIRTRKTTGVIQNGSSDGTVKNNPILTCLTGLFANSSNGNLEKYGNHKRHIHSVPGINHTIR